MHLSSYTNLCFVHVYLSKKQFIHKKTYNFQLVHEVPGHHQLAAIPCMMLKVEAF